MKKREIVKKQSRFTEIIKTGIYQKNSFFVLYYKQLETIDLKFGITVPKKIGTAVIRNRLKRQIKDIIDKNKFSFKNGFEYIIMVRKAALDLTYEQLKKELLHLTKR